MMTAYNPYPLSRTEMGSREIKQSAIRGSLLRFLAHRDIQHIPFLRYRFLSAFRDNMYFDKHGTKLWRLFHPATEQLPQM